MVRTRRVLMIKERIWMIMNVMEWIMMKVETKVMMKVMMMVEATIKIMKPREEVVVAVSVAVAVAADPTLLSMRKALSQIYQYQKLFRLRPSHHLYYDAILPTHPFEL